MTWRRIAIAEKTIEISQDNLRIAQDTQITERFTRAIDQLGDKERIEVRLGGIYALERIARDSERDHWPIMEVLMAFIRHNSHSVDQPSQPRKDRGHQPTSDIQATLNVIARRSKQYDEQNQRIDFSNSDLAYLDLRDTDLSRAVLASANLTGARIRRAELTEAILQESNLENADLLNCRLPYSDLRSANLKAANLFKADLREANLSGANLTGAILSAVDLRGAIVSSTIFDNAVLSGTDLRGVNLEGAIGLSTDQVIEAVLDEATILPDYLQGETSCNLSVLRTHSSPTVNERSAD